MVWLCKKEVQKTQKKLTFLCREPKSAYKAVTAVAKWLRTIFCLKDLIKKRKTMPSWKNVTRNVTTPVTRGGEGVSRTTCFSISSTCFFLYKWCFMSLWKNPYQIHFPRLWLVECFLILWNGDSEEWKCFCRIIFFSFFSHPIGRKVCYKCLFFCVKVYLYMHIKTHEKFNYFTPFHVMFKILMTADPELWD